MRSHLLLAIIACTFFAACGGTDSISTPVPSTPASSTVAPSATAPPAAAIELRKGDGPAIYRLMDDGTLRHIPTWADFVALGYDDLPVTTVDNSALARHPLGPALVGGGTVELTNTERNPFSHMTAVAHDPASATLWIGTAFAGLFACPWSEPAPSVDEMTYADFEATGCTNYTTFTGALLDNQVQALLLAADNSLWVASPGGLARFVAEQWQTIPLATGATTNGALAVAQDKQGTIWVGGDGYIGYSTDGVAWQVHTAIDQPLLADRFTTVSIDSAGTVHITGQKGRLTFDGATWQAATLAGTNAIPFQPNPAPPSDIIPPPLDFPDPHSAYHDWLQQWPRPAGDNGRCMHFVQMSWLNVDDAQRHIEQLRQLNARWTVVPYANHFQLRRLAPLFAEAGIMVVWRPFVRPDEQYAWWQEDIHYLREWGIPPYMQLYNEPSLAQEWEGVGNSAPGKIEQERFLQNLVAAVEQVDAAGGYVGLQAIDQAWLRAILRRLTTAGLADRVDRLFFVPHPYGLNHPPAYDEDESSVLGFRVFAEIFEAEWGFVPMMIAGEGGWRPGEAQDERYPAVTEALHQEYHVALFEWFRRGKLSTGEPLPDYLFAFCPWLLADGVDPAAWFDGKGESRYTTAQTVAALPPFVRKFSWE